MSKTLRLLSLAVLLATGSAAAIGDDGHMIGSQLAGRPPTDDTVTTREGPYYTKPISPDATNPNRSPTGGDGSASSSGIGDSNRYAGGCAGTC